MNNKPNRLTVFFNEKLKLFLSISFGIFLFILFFQPFQLDRFDFNNRLLFVAGFGAIIFLILGLTWMILPSKRDARDPGFKPLVYLYLRGLMTLTLSSVAFAFYLRYVGGVGISFYIIFKIIIICLATLVIDRFYEVSIDIKQQNEALLSEKRVIQDQIEKYEDDIVNKTIEFNSENNTETLTLLVSDIAFIKSADNYVEIVYREGEGFKRNLIRNTLKNIELQLKDFTSFVRCHRMCIVNRLYIEKLSRNYNNYIITIRGYKEQIPVSRQYLLKIKEAL